MLQQFQTICHPLTVNSSSYGFHLQRHLTTVKVCVFTLILGTGLFFQTILFPLPAFSQSKEVYPAGDTEYFKALLELEKDEAYKKFLLQSVSYADGKKVDYIDYKGVRLAVDEDGTEPADTETAAAHFRKQTYEAMRNMDWFRKNNYQNFIRNVGQNIYPLIIASDYEPGKEGDRQHLFLVPKRPSCRNGFADFRHVRDGKNPSAPSHGSLLFNLPLL